MQHDFVSTILQQDQLAAKVYVATEVGKRAWKIFMSKNPNHTGSSKESESSKRAAASAGAIFDGHGNVCGF